MLDQAFSPHSLLRLVRREDVARYRLWRSGEDRVAIIQHIADTINNSDFELPTFREKETKGKTIFAAPTATSMLALRKLDRNIRALYQVKQANRDNLIKQVISLLQEGRAFNVLRLDIRSFYEHINSTSLLEQIAQDSILSYKSRNMLRILFEMPQLSLKLGVPRGLGVSATLAELYSRSLDRHIRSLSHVYFYDRYVDDMIVFTHAAAAKAEFDIVAALDQLGLTLNSDKKFVKEYYGTKKPKDLTTDGFEFLGYYIVPRLFLDKKDSWRDVSIRIASSKVKKIKSRIAHALAAYLISSDFSLLSKRMKFLAGNYVLRGRENGGLCGGIYYNYHYITDTSDLDDLDIFYRRLLFAKRGSLGKRLSIKLTNHQRKELLKISFRKAFEQRLSCRLSWGTMKILRKCWAYEKN